MTSLSQSIKRKASELGFNRIGIVPATPSPMLDAYFDWIEQGMHGKMGYLAREDRQIRRENPQVIMPELQSMVIVALDYSSLQPPQDILQDKTRGRISNYAWGVDYHDLMLPRLEALAMWLQNELGESQQVVSRAYVDTGAILERSHAHQAGLGFIGKNTMLIHPQRGSYFFLGELLLSIDFNTVNVDSQYDQPQRETMCGSCTKCLTACPTDAFPKPYVLDARKCISYLTIELKAEIPVNLRPQLGNWIYGCDICQEVCPWNRFAIQTIETEFFPASIDRVAPPLAELLALDNDSFKSYFENSPIIRIKRERMVRNACVAAGNSGLPEFLPQLEKLAQHDESDLVREHAMWAIQQINQ